MEQRPRSWRSSSSPHWKVGIKCTEEQDFSCELLSQGVKLTQLRAKLLILAFSWKMWASVSHHYQITHYYKVM